MLAFGLLLSARLNWALGRVLTPLLLLGLLWQLLWLHNHLVDNLPRCGCYTYAPDMKINAMQILLYVKTKLTQLVLHLQHGSNSNYPFNKS